MNQNAKNANAGKPVGEPRRHWERPPVWPGRNIGSAAEQKTSDQSLSRVAQSILNLRAQRAVVFGPQVAANLSDPSWDMFLELFIAHVANRNISPTYLWLATNVSQSRALRHISVMVENGFVVRQTDPTDNRRIILSLTPSGVDSMRKLLSSMAGEF